MAQEFKHIRVQASDDEEVIQAGAASAGNQMAQEAPAVQNAPGFGGAAATQKAQTQPQEPAIEPVREKPRAAQAPASPKPAQKQPAPQEDPAAEKKARREKKKKDKYRETTLEDLRDTKMPKTQAIVIVCAVVFLIVGIAYFALAI